MPSKQSLVLTLKIEIGSDSANLKLSRVGSVPDPARVQALAEVLESGAIVTKDGSRQVSKVSEAKLIRTTVTDALAMEIGWA
ncbi:hypothetical protein [Lacticaseibacillus hegangensis]|uniref:DUF2922 domain-containing protein n=1 Tax=Lacticaseibacillus hegangensis TaxID=2486010 RepID=A0ABW4D039_9LACO|nr:hypothetical protein [Lacticaseibacillus hegangensis]